MRCNVELAGGYELFQCFHRSVKDVHVVDGDQFVTDRNASTCCRAAYTYAVTL